MLLDAPPAQDHQLTNAIPALLTTSSTDLLVWITVPLDHSRADPHVKDACLVVEPVTAETTVPHVQELKS